jgi:hypothetical protein
MLMADLAALKEEKARLSGLIGQETSCDEEARQGWISLGIIGRQWQGM